MPQSSEEHNDEYAKFASRPVYESQKYGFRGPLAGSGDPEYVDEPPGSYLRTLELGPGAVVLAGLVFATTLVAAVLVALVEPWTRLSLDLATVLRADVPSWHDLEPFWVAPLELVWTTAPIAALAGFLLCAFVRANVGAATRTVRRMMSASIWLHLAALAVWALVHFGLDATIDTRAPWL